MLPRLFIIVFLFNVLCFAFWSISNAQDSKEITGEKIFKNCAGCHLKGQNLIKQDKPIIGSSKLASKVVFKEFISVPHKPMPSFKNIADSKEELDALYNYVNSLK